MSQSSLSDFSREARNLHPPTDADPYEYEHPSGRRSMLRRRYEARATDVWRAAVHPQTTAIYDILRVGVREVDASYDELVERTGLARSTVRYHVAKLEDQGVLKRPGDPVLVVYDGEALRERAEKILESVRQEDTPGDTEGRAMEHEERREAQKSDDDTHGDDGEGGRARSAWEYLSALRLSAEDLYVELDTADGAFDGEDVRVRCERVPDRLR